MVHNSALHITQKEMSKRDFLNLSSTDQSVGRGFDFSVPTSRGGRGGMRGGGGMGMGRGCGAFPQDYGQGGWQQGYGGGPPASYPPPSQGGMGTDQGQGGWQSMGLNSSQQQLYPQQQSQPYGSQQHPLAPLPPPNHPPPPVPAAVSAGGLQGAVGHGMRQTPESRPDYPSNPVHARNDEANPSLESANPTKAIMDVLTQSLKTQ
eukprot:3937953-Rhodomonas_salina.1